MYNVIKGKFNYKGGDKMLIDIISTNNIQSYNVWLAHKIGLNNSIYLGVNNLKFKVIFMISKFGFNNKRLKIPIMKPFNMGKLTNLLKLFNIFLFI